jgi:hypothetical protein
LAEEGNWNKTIQITDDRGRTIVVIWMPEQGEPFFRAIDFSFDQKVRISKEG